MPLNTTQALWLHRFTNGTVPLPVDPNAPPLTPEQTDKRLMEQLEMLQAREWAEEQALKTVLLSKAFKVLEAHKEEMRLAFDMKVETWDEEDDQVSKKNSTVQNVRDKDGRQERAYDSMESTRLKTVQEREVQGKKLTATNATQSMALLVVEKDKLANEMTRRSRIVLKGKVKVIEQYSTELFSDPELMNELYTPLVRDLVLPETFIPPKYSATQQMIDATDDYYIKECKSKGKPMPTGAAALSKGAINLGAAVANTVVGSFSEVKPGQEGMATSGKLSKQMVARAGDITTGIAALLTGAVDVVDQIDDLRKSGDFSNAGYQTVCNALAMGLGKIVSGATGDITLGMVITDTISGAVSLSAIAGEVAVWKKKGGDFPLDSLISLVGKGVASGLSAASDKTSDTEGHPTSTAFAQASQGVTQIFETAARGAKAKLHEQIRAGNWGAVFDFLKETAVEVGKQLPSQIYLDKHFNELGTDSQGNTIDEYDKQKITGQSIGDTATEIEKGGGGLSKLIDEGVKQVGKGVDLPQTPQQKRMAEIEKAFEQKKKELEALAEKDAAGEVENIVKQMEKEKEEYQQSLLCLGSTNPSDSDFKSIAKLVEQLERDRAIWDGLTALFGAGIGAASGMVLAMSVAQEVAPALKVAGQLVKYCVNLKAAADRCDAWLTWREGRKDAESAVSPYATSIDNFTKNQGQQFTHYSIQAAANAIQALLACGEMSPLAPAFKAAGGGVAAAAAAEDLIYQFYKKNALRNAWKTTQKALDPKNKGNRKIALLARQVNPTLAKYTVAYGALVEQSPVAITCCNRLGIDRETLARSGDKVGELKDYFSKLYPDDGEVVGVLDVTPGKTKVPKPALTTKAWALSVLVWTEEHQLRTANPPTIVAHLALVEELVAKKARKPEETEQLVSSLTVLQSAFMSFEPQTEHGAAIPAIKQAVADYADLAEVQGMALAMEIDAVADTV